MAKQIRAARHYQSRNDPLRRIADRTIPNIKSDLKDALKGLAELIPQDADYPASTGNWYAVKSAIDWGHFREVLKGVFGQIGKAREAGAQHGAQQINRSFAVAGRKVRFRKDYNPDEPRDERGRWTTGGSSSASISVAGKDVTVSLSRVDQAMGYRLANIDVHALNAAWSKDHGFYIGTQGGGNAISEVGISRYDRFGEWIKANDHMEASSVGVQADGSVGFDNGRHRFAWLRDQGLTTIPVAMDKESIENARRHGYLSEKVLKFTLSPLLGNVRKDANDKYAFDLYSQDVQDQLRAAQDDLIAELEQDVRDAIDEIVMSGARLGLGPDEIMDDIRDMVGLTARQSQAAMNYRDMLENLDPGALQRQLRNFLEDDNVQAALDAGQPMDAVMVDKLTSDYIDNYIDYRAETIAQTEATRAVSLGLQDSYQQAIDRGVFPSEAVKQFWKIELDDVTCPICTSIPDMNPDGVAIDEAFDSVDGPQDAPPDPHPSCRCSIDIVTDLSMVDSSDVDAGEAA